MMTEEAIRIELTDKANEAVAYILKHNLSPSEAAPKLKARGFSAEDIRSALAYIGLVRAEEERDFRTAELEAAAKLRAKPKPIPAPPPAEPTEPTKVEWLRPNFAATKKSRGEAGFFVPPIQPGHAPQPSPAEPMDALLKELEEEQGEPTVQEPEPKIEPEPEEVEPSKGELQIVEPQSGLHAQEQRQSMGRDFPSTHRSSASMAHSGRQELGMASAQTSLIGARRGDWKRHGKFDRFDNFSRTDWAQPYAKPGQGIAHHRRIAGDCRSNPMSATLAATSGWASSVEGGERSGVASGSTSGEGTQSAGRVPPTSDVETI
jgi:hypothetical protein